MLLFQHPAKTDCFCWILQPFWRIEFLCHFFFHVSTVSNVTPVSGFSCFCWPDRTSVQTTGKICSLCLSSAEGDSVEFRQENTCIYCCIYWPRKWLTGRWMTMHAMCMCQVQMYFEVFFCVFEMEDIGALQAETQQRQMDEKTENHLRHRTYFVAFPYRYSFKVTFGYFSLHRHTAEWDCACDLARARPADSRTRRRGKQELVWITIPAQCILV